MQREKEINNYQEKIRMIAFFRDFFARGQKVGTKVIGSYFKYEWSWMRFGKPKTRLSLEGGKSRDLVHLASFPTHTQL